MNWSIRTRASVYMAALVGVLLTVFGVGLVTAVTVNLTRDFEARMERDGELLAELFKEELRLDALEEFNEEATELGLTLRVADLQGRVVFQSRMWLQHGLGSFPIPNAETDRWSAVPEMDDPHLILTRPILIGGEPLYTLQMAESNDALLAARREMLKWSALLIPFMVVVSVLLGLAFGRKALAPVERLRRQAEALQPEDLSARLPYPAVKDELYALTETLNRAFDRIEEAFSKMKRFTADASHELRGPLTALRGALELALRRDRTIPEYREAIADALDEAERLSRLANDLLTIARADAGETALNLVEVEIRGFLEALVRDHPLRNQYPGFPVSLGEVPEGRAVFDPDQIQRVLLNLIENAAKYAGSPEGVRLSATKDDKHVAIVVRDFGPGIAPEHRTRIFDRFYRADAARLRETGGAGLGLAIALGIAKAHGGALRLRNTSESGSEFELVLPLETSHPILKRR